MENIDLNKIKKTYNQQKAKIKKRVVICGGTGCIANGSMDVYHEFVNQIKESGLDVIIELNEHTCVDDKKDSILLTGSGCQGFCAQGPLVNIYPDEVLYVKVHPENVKEIVQNTLINDDVIDELLYVNTVTKEKSKGCNEIPFYNRQERGVLEACGNLDPENIEKYISRDGYQAARKAFTEKSSKRILSNSY